jgi:23S rRNA-/tRNA-specific pseudouridylate synthase
MGRLRRVTGRDNRHKGEDGSWRSQPRILHRDAELVIVDKPPGVLTSGGEDAMDGILARYLEQQTGEQPPYLTHCHQLDAPTSGLPGLASVRTIGAGAP